MRKLNWSPYQEEGVPALGNKCSTHNVLHLLGPSSFLQSTDEENKKWDYRSLPRQAASVRIKFAEQCAQLLCLKFLILKVRITRVLLGVGMRRKRNVSCEAVRIMPVT